MLQYNAIQYFAILYTNIYIHKHRYSSVIKQSYVDDSKKQLGMYHSSGIALGVRYWLTSIPTRGLSGLRREVSMEDGTCIFAVRYKPLFSDIN